MSKYSIKSVVRRGSMLGAAFALLAATVVPAASTYADALNPLTDRSLTLSSSSPGWDFKDGSGNSTYAPPNSGANGQKTGNYFSFKVSSAATVNTLSFQYCTTSAGKCFAPGNNGYTGSSPTATRNGDSATTSDLNITNSGAAEIDAGDFGTIIDDETGNIKAVPGADIVQVNNGTTPGNTVAGNYVVYYLDTTDTTAGPGGTWKPSSGWNLSVHNVESEAVGDATGATGKNNYMVLTQAAGQPLTAGQQVKVMFFASDNDFYITNPGASWFFVKINTYNKEYAASPTGGQVDLTGLAPDSEANIIDGGVTVANVMNQSIRIQTKVLETMQFSVGTVDPNTLDSTGGASSPFGVAFGGFRTDHTICDPIVGSLNNADAAKNVLRMGNIDAENSLSVEKTYSTHSFWRLSSNSSAGATVYYSGNTLSNTVGDTISEMATKGVAAKGSEQFGLALTTNGDAGVFTTNYDTETDSNKVFEQGADGSPSGIHTASLTDDNVISNLSWHTPKLFPLIPASDYADGAGVVNPGDYTGTQAQFKFLSSSTLIPEPIASEDTDVVDCVTGRMRYIANIAATTPAGIYTTAINYIAAPQY